jgi:hypothetical protein
MTNVTAARGATNKRQNANMKKQRHLGAVLLFGFF